MTGNYNVGDRVRMNNPSSAQIGMPGTILSVHVCNSSGAKSYYVKWDNGAEVLMPPEWIMEF